MKSEQPSTASIPHIVVYAYKIESKRKKEKEGDNQKKEKRIEERNEEQDHI